MLAVLNVGSKYRWCILSIFLFFALNGFCIFRNLVFGIKSFLSVGSFLFKWYCSFEERTENTQESNTRNPFLLSILTFLYFGLAIFFSCFILVKCVILFGVNYDEIWRTCVEVRRMIVFRLRGVLIGRRMAAAREHRGFEARRTRQKDNIQHMNTLRTEIFESVEDLRALSIRDLKDRLRWRQIPSKRLFDKSGILQALQDADNTSAKSCSICFNDYASGEQLKVLPCGHKYHKECIEQWFRMSMNYTDNPPKCPYCNTLIFSER